jgi:septal ring factor EnvC (AmiA/AmiB activator)
LNENKQQETETILAGTGRPNQKYDDIFWAKVQKIIIICTLLFLGGAFVFTGLEAYLGRRTDGTAASVELERITGELERAKGELRDTEQRAVELTTELRSVRSELGRITAYSKQLEDKLGNARTVSAAIGTSIGILDGTNQAVENAIKDIDRIISATNQANSIP